MPKQAFECLDCGSYILSNSHCCDGLHCPGCGGPIMTIPYAERNFKKKNIIKPEEHDLVIVCDGPNELKVFNNGHEVKAVTEIKFSASINKQVPELSITQFIVGPDIKC